MTPWRDVPAAVRPMLASLDEPPLAQRGLIYERKYDGIRAVVELGPAIAQPLARSHQTLPTVALYSRNGKDKTRQFPALAAVLRAIAAKLDAPLLVDGEIVALDSRGRPLGFQDIQGRIHLTGDAEIARAEREHPVALIVFDLLREGDQDLRTEPLAARRLALQRCLRLTPAVQRALRLSEIAADDGRPMLARARAEGWEGLIVKDGRSRYYSGRRTPAWRKLKLLKQQELIVGGWTEPRLSRQDFGALLLGYYADPAGLPRRGATAAKASATSLPAVAQRARVSAAALPAEAQRAKAGATGTLIYAGSVGTGFDQDDLARLATLLKARARATSPFSTTVRTAEPAHWVTPTLVVEVRFAEWTTDGLLRQPVYLGMRDDKRARDVRREEATPLAGPPRAVSARRARTSKTEPGEVNTGDLRSASDLATQLSALEDARKDGIIRLPDGHTLRVTNLAKIFWPGLGLTKGDLLRYYVAVAPLILPAVDDRPLVMKRSPNGIDRPAFYQQRHPETAPAGVRRESLAERVDPIDGSSGRERLIGGSLTTLLYMTQLAAVSQDPWFSRLADPLHPDQAAIDLDPGEGTSFATVQDVARWIKEELDRFGIPATPKTSGSRGLHIYLPLPPKTTYETGQLLCRIIATIVSDKHPRAATIERVVKKRARGTVYVDFLQNILGKTLATAYSARATDYAGVSTPLTWKDIDEGVNPRDFTMRTAPERFAHVGDLWARLRTGSAADLSAILRRMGVAGG